jgi:DNA-binding transcriptional ArsR family regulator
VSQHLRVVREHGFVSVRPDGARRLYRVDGTGMRDIDAWLDSFRRFWAPPLAAAETEVARGRRQRRERSR